MATEEIHLVLLIHGIRTRAAWVPRVRNALEGDDIQVRPCNYSYFDVLRFWWPGRTRDVPVALVERQIRSYKNEFESKGYRVKISAIAHSFGTYIVSRILEDATDLRWERLILCGAIVPENFRWDKVRGQIDAENVINEVGRRDIWPVMAKLLTFGYGDAGTYGFGYGARDRFHNVGHGGYFEGDFPERFWKPWFHSRDWVEPQVEPGESPFPGWLGARGLNRIGFSAVALAGLVPLCLVLGLPVALWARAWWYVYLVGVVALGVAIVMGWRSHWRWATLIGSSVLIVGSVLGLRLWLGPSYYHVDRALFSELRAAGSWDNSPKVKLVGVLEKVPNEVALAPNRLRVDVTQGTIEKTIRSDQRPTIPTPEPLYFSISDLSRDAPVQVRVRVSDPHGVLIDEWDVPVQIGGSQ